MSKERREDLKKDDFSINTAAEASVFGLGSVSKSYEFGTTTEDSKKYQNSVDSTRIVTIGSKLPENGKVKVLNWQAKIKLILKIFIASARQCNLNWMHNSP